MRRVSRNIWCARASLLRRPGEPRAHEQRAHAGDEAFSEAEVGGPFPRAIEDQQLLLDKNGLCHRGSGAARAGEPGDRRQQMEKQDGQIAYGPIVTSWRNPRKPRNVEFAMHRIEEVVTAPHAPWQNPFRRAICGSVRRECFDHVIAFNEAGVRKLMRHYGSYYEKTRTHCVVSYDLDSRPRRMR